MTRWLSRVGGASGWVLSTQVPSLDGVNERAAEHGVRIAVQAQAQGRRIVQFHPLDLGVLLELDEFLPRGAWFWDDLEAAQAAQASRSTKVDDIVAADVAAQDPAAMAATWAAIIGLAPRLPPRTAPRSPLAAGPSGSCPLRAAAPESSPSTCTPPTASTASASMASCVTRSSASSSSVLVQQP
jgi:hypothetical protein